MIIDINVARNARNAKNSIQDTIKQHLGENAFDLSFFKDKYMVTIKVGYKPSMQTLQNLSSLPPTLNGFEVNYEVTA